MNRQLRSVVLRNPRRVASAMAATALLGAVLVLTAASPAKAATLASFRMGHFSPDTPPVDIYVTGFDGGERLVLPSLGYGQVSTYVTTPSGLYTLSLRPAGAASDTPSKVITSTELADGAAYTFAAMGRNAELRSVVIGDDLGGPPDGQAKVRVVNATSQTPTLDVAAQDGPVLASGLAFGSTSDYVVVPAGGWNVHVTGTGADVTQRLDLAAGSVNSVVAIEGANGQPELTRVVDATVGVLGVSEERGATVDAPVPAGGMQTGAGGLATSTTSSSSAPLVGGLVVAVLAVGAVAGLGRGRRSVPRT